MEQEKGQIICPNCGAEYDIHLPKCPYCDFINPEGAEEKYLKDLDKVRQELDHVDELAAERIKSEVKNSTKKLGKRILTIGIVFLLFVGLIFLADHLISSGHSDYELTEKELTWQNEAFKELDSLYESGSYEEAGELLNRYAEENHRVWDWKHYSFISWYLEYLQIRDDLKTLEEDGKCSEPLGRILVRHMFEYYDLDTDRMTSEGIKDENETAVLSACREEVVLAVHERLGFSEEQMERLLSEARDEYGYLDYKKCDKIAKEYYHQFR